MNSILTISFIKKNNNSLYLIKQNKKNTNSIKFFSSFQEIIEQII
jgi:hypothetical protein